MRDGPPAGCGRVTRFAPTARSELSQSRTSLGSQGFGHLAGCIHLQGALQARCTTRACCLAQPHLLTPFGLNKIAMDAPPQAGQATQGVWPGLRRLKIRRQYPPTRHSEQLSARPASPEEMPPLESSPGGKASTKSPLPECSHTLGNVSCKASARAVFPLREAPLSTTSCPLTLPCRPFTDLRQGRWPNI